MMCHVALFHSKEELENGLAYVRTSFTAHSELQGKRRVTQFLVDSTTRYATLRCDAGTFVGTAVVDDGWKTRELRWRRKK